MTHAELIAEYLAGPKLLRHAVEKLTDEQLDARPIPQRWSTRQVVCHIADFEPIYADRMKRVIAEDTPSFFGGDPDVFAAGLAYKDRRVEEELRLIEVTRQQMARILNTLSSESFQRTGRHAEDGLIDLQTLLLRITQHLPHHVKFINEKREALR